MPVAITAAVLALAAGGALGLGGGDQQEVRHVLAPGLAGVGLADDVGPAQCRPQRDDPLVLALHHVVTDFLAQPRNQLPDSSAYFNAPGFANRCSAMMGKD